MEVKEIFESPDNWTPGTTTPKEVYVTNKGETTAAVRIKLTESWKDKNGNPVDLMDANNVEAAIINYGYDKDIRWVKDGDYYYYIRPVDENQSTSSLIESVTFNPDVTIGVTTECVTDDITQTKTCTSSVNGYGGGTYKLIIDIETCQYDKYKEIWNTNIEISKPAPSETGTLMPSYSTSQVFGKTINRSLFETVAFVDTISIPSYAIDSWDVSVEQDESVMAWYTDSDNDDLYELYIGQEGGVNANPDCSFMFNNYYKVSKYYLNDLNTSNVTNMRAMFMNASKDSDSFELIITDWDFSNVTNNTEMFNYFGRYAKKGKFVLKNVNLVNTGIQYNMFRYFASGVKDLEFTIENGTFPVMTGTSYIFEGIGSSADKVVFTMNNVEFPNATSLSEMFNNMAYNAKDVDITITNLSAPQATTMGRVFQSVSRGSTNIVVKNWNTPSLTNASNMFYYAGSSSESTNILVSNLDVSHVTNMSYMFQDVGNNSNVVHLKLENFDTSSVTHMSGMFYQSGNNSSTLVIDGEIDVYADNISYMFKDTKGTNATINIYSNPTTYGSAFSNAAIKDGSQITVNYSSSTTNIDNIIATKSSNSNVVKGSILD